MHTTDDLLSLVRFNRDANRQVLETAALLSPDDFARSVSPSHESVCGLLIHILGGEVYFPAMIRGETPDMSSLEALATLDDIRAHWAGADAAFEATVQQAGDDVDRLVDIHFGPTTFTLPLWQVVLQTVIHAHQHRGELSIVLSQLGHPLPLSDLMKHFILESGQAWPYD